MSKYTGVPGPKPNARAAATALLASDWPSAAACDGLIFATKGTFVHGACLPTQSGANRHPSAATLLTQVVVKFP